MTFASRITRATLAAVARWSMLRAQLLREIPRLVVMPYVFSFATRYVVKGAAQIRDRSTRTNHNYEETGVMISEVAYQSLTEEQRAAILQAINQIAPWHYQQVGAQIAESEEKMADEGIVIEDVIIATLKAHFRSSFDTIVEIVGYAPDLVEELKSQ